MITLWKQFVSLFLDKMRGTRGFEIKLYLAKKIPENTDRVVSSLILTIVYYCRTLSLRLSCIWEYRFLRIQIELYPGVLLRNLEFEIEFYLVKQIPEYTDRFVSGGIMTSVLLWKLEFKIELYLVIQIELYLDWYWLRYYLGTLSMRLSCIL